MIRVLRFLTPVVLAAAVLAVPARADHRDQLFREGNRLYQEGQYREAIVSYQRILETGHASAPLYYNLGNAWYKSGEIARAILNYERALKLRPHDEDTRFNLQVAKLGVVDKVPEILQMFHVRWFRSWRRLFGARALAALTAVCYVLFMAALIGVVLQKSPSLRRGIRIPILILGIGLTIFAATFFSSLHVQRSVSEAVVMSPRSDVLSAPGEDGTVIFTIHAGLKVRVTRERDTWREIRLPDGKQGWLASSHLEII